MNRNRAILDVVVGRYDCVVLWQAKSQDRSSVPDGQALFFFPLVH